MNAILDVWCDVALGWIGDEQTWDLVPECLVDKLRIYSSNQKLLEAHIDPNDGTLQLKTSASDLGCHKFDVFMFSDRY